MTIENLRGGETFFYKNAFFIAIETTYTNSWGMNFNALRLKDGRPVFIPKEAELILPAYEEKYL